MTVCFFQGVLTQEKISGFSDKCEASLHFNSLPGELRLAGTRMSSLWIHLELRTMEVVVTTGAVRLAKLKLNCHHQQTNNQLFTGRMPFPSPNQQCQSTEGKRCGTFKKLTTCNHILVC